MDPQFITGLASAIVRARTEHGNVKVGFVRMGGRVERQAGARVGRRELDPREAGECVGREFAVRRL